MNQSHPLEITLGNLLKYGTLTLWILISLGVLLNAADISTPGIDLVTIGIVGFLVLPTVGLIAMLRTWLAGRDHAMARVVVIVLALVVSGLIVGIVA